MNPLEFLSLFAAAWRASRKDHTAFVAAGLSFFTMFSLVPVFLVVVTLAGLVWGETVASGEVMNAMSAWMGGDAARLMSHMLSGAARPGAAGWVSAVAVLLGASVLFIYLRHALDLLWGLERQRGVRSVLAERFFSFMMVVFVGFLMVFFFGIHVVLAMIWERWGGLVPSLGGIESWKLANTLFAFVALSLLFAVVYRVLPSRRMRWKEALVGGTVTSALLSMANHLIGMYFAHALFRSVYGAGATALIILLWVYLSAHVFLFGAEFTWAYRCALRRGEECDGQEKERGLNGGETPASGSPVG